MSVLAPASSPIAPQVAAKPEKLRVSELRGLEAVLRLQPRLAALAARSGQLGAVDYLEYFLTGPYVGEKTPCLFLVHADSQDSRSPRESATQALFGAVLLFEYRVRGLRTGIYITDDDGGERTVLGPPGDRARIAAHLVTWLLESGARLLLLSLQAESTALQSAMQSAQARSHLWATRRRELRSYLPLLPTYDETLARMGKHTRRNLRAFHRRAESELSAIFVESPELTEEQFLVLNRRCSYPVPEAVASWRYRTVNSLEGGFTVALHSATSGGWLSLLGGRRHHGTTEIGWQMNRADLEAYSLGTAMRSSLIEHEVARGTRQLFFEGGTPHSMQSAFLPTPVLDLMVSSSSPASALLRRVAPHFLPEKNFLREMLRDPDLRWT